MQVFSAGTHDLKCAWQERRIWLMLAGRSLKYFYRRTSLGPLWFAVDQLIYTLAFSVLNVVLFGGDFGGVVVYVGLGVGIFSSFTQVVNVTLGSLVNSTGFRGTPLSFSGRILRDLLTATAEGLFRTLPVVIIGPLFGVTPTWSFLLIVPGLCLAMSAAFFSGIILSVIFARFRDIGPMISLIMRISFLGCPVIWHPDQIKNSVYLDFLMKGNPFTSFLDVLRTPLLGLNPNPMSYYLVLIWIIASSVLSIYVIGFAFPKLSYWLS